MINAKYTFTATLSSLFLMASAHAADGGQYSIDPAHSKVGFEVPHLVISSVEGSFNEMEGSISLNEKDFTKSKLNATVKAASIDTGIKKRDDHLRSGVFFQVKKYPELKFVSKSIKGDKKKFKMTGDLTIKGVTKRVTLEGKYLGSVKDGYGNLKTAFVAETTIDRKDFGLTWNSMVEAGPVVGDEVTIKLNIQAGKPLSKNTASNGS